MSGGVTPVFHRYYDEVDLRPNFYLDEQARDLGTTGHRKRHVKPAQCPVRGHIPSPRLPLRPAVPREDDTKV